MLTVSDLSLQFRDRLLFSHVDLQFTKGNCYGIIGANGAGKSTFLKILSGDLEATTGAVTILPELRMSVLKQDQNMYDAYTVLDTVIMGNPKLYQVGQERDALYAKEEMSEEDGILACELEETFAELGGWEAESEASRILQGLGVDTEHHQGSMANLDPRLKVNVLLAQALFGSPDILIMDEPTNNLDIDAVNWLEDFLLDFESTVIVVSHDRHFLNTVCTHIVDIDYGKIKMYVGNYDFWFESSQMIQQLVKNQNKRNEEKIKELQDFISRFSANKSKSKQATARRKLLDKLTVEELPASSRRYPWVKFSPDREEWGTTATFAYFPKDNSEFFEDCDDNLVEWLRQYSPDPSELYLRGFLGRMLFSGDEVYKPVKVLSGGEKVRCMLSRMMLSGGNVLLLDQPTNHLDLESIAALNKGLEAVKCNILLACHDHQLVETVCNRIFDFTADGKLIDRKLSYDEYLARKAEEGA